jgi:hypothetical protein
MRTVREREILGKKLSQCRSVYHKSHKNWPGIQRGVSRFEVLNYKLGYNTASKIQVTFIFVIDYTKQTVT